MIRRPYDQQREVSNCTSLLQRCSYEFYHIVTGKPFFYIIVNRTHYVSTCICIQVYAHMHTANMAIYLYLTECSDVYYPQIMKSIAVR